MSDVLIVGAGVTGLSCAGLLRENGIDVRVVEKSRGVGGRCATRRIEGTPVDHGLAFYHGDDPEFLSALRSVEPEAPHPWPRRLRGSGAPCQPRAAHEKQERLAFVSGVSAFPRHLARGIPVELETRATRIVPTAGHLVVQTAHGQRHRARSIVLALPAGQVPGLLETVAPEMSRDLAGTTKLLAGISMVRCLTLMAGYPPDTPSPDWDVCYPEDSDILQMVSRDSSKRPSLEQPVVVFQTGPSWSARHWDERSTVWTDTVLDHARSMCGDWVMRPDWIDTQRWRYARLSGGDTLTRPLLVRLVNGSRIGIAGEAMAGSGGVQGAWLSGRQMARRLLGDETA